MKSKWLYIGVAGALGVLGIVWWQTQKAAAPSGAQNAVDPNAQIGGGLPAMGTAPDIGNLLSYNQIPGVMSTPQATSVDPYITSNYFNPSSSNLPTSGTPGPLQWLFTNNYFNPSSNNLPTSGTPTPLQGLP